MAAPSATAPAIPLVTGDMTMDWAQYQFPELFGTEVVERFPAIDHLGVTYNARAYLGPTGWRYLGVTVDGRVFGLGDFTGGALQPYDTVSAWAPRVWADWCRVRPSDCSATGPGYGIGQPVRPADAVVSEVAESASGEPVSVLLADGSVASLPAQDAGFAAQLEREAGLDADTAAVIASRPGLQATGSARGLYVVGMGDPSDLKPSIALPAGEAAGLDPDTLSVLRIGPVVVNGEMVFDHEALLPVTLAADGSISFVDPFFRDGLFPSSVVSPSGSRARALAARRSAGAEPTEWIGGARYQLVTYQADLNWSREPQLVRMIPDASRAASGWRRPATDAERAALARQSLCHVVLLVHGHNEEEQGGNAASTDVAPWMQSYKRRVWDLFYQQALGVDLSGRPLYPTACTAFYEFIYPSYRPIYSPVSDKGGGLRETLGESLGRLIGSEWQRDPQLAALVANDMPLRIVVVGHSQGGLVARAGLRFTPEPIKRRVERLVTWGTPHHGASLYSLRFAMQRGHDLVIDGYRLPLQNVVQSKIAAQALDTPGTRDLRLEARYRDRIDLRALMPRLSQADEDALYPHVFSRNLEEFNNNVGTREVDPGPIYAFLTGTKVGSATLEHEQTTGAWWAQFRRQQYVRFQHQASGTEKGATLDRLLLRSAFRASDGAVPLFSQQGAGLDGPERENLGDIDHEEFYGSEPPNCQAASLSKGRLTAERTLGKARLGDLDNACPSLQGLASTLDGGTLTLRGSIQVPRLSRTPERIGSMVAGIHARAGSRDGPVIDALALRSDARGGISASAPASTVPGGLVVVVVTFKDGSELQAPVNVEASSGFVATRVFEQPWTITENREGSMRASLNRQVSGTRLQCELAVTWTLPSAHAQPLQLRVLRREIADDIVRNESFAITYLSYGGRVMPRGDGTHASRNGTYTSPATTWTRSDQGFARTLSLLPAERLETSAYDKVPTLYLELRGLCGASDVTQIRMDYAQR